MTMTQHIQFLSTPPEEAREQMLGKELVIAIGAEGSPVRKIQEHPYATLEEIKRLKNILRIIAYPKRGTEEEQVDIFKAAEIIQKNYTLEQLEKP